MCATSSSYGVFVAIIVALVYGQTDEHWVNHGNSSYYLSWVKMNFHHAKLRCLDLGGYLAEVESHQEVEVLRFLVAHYQGGHEGFYLGAKRYNGIWTWQHSYKGLTVSDWGFAEPNNKHYLGGSENCIIMFKEKHYHWNDINCILPYFFICEKDRKISLPTTQSTTASPVNLGPLVPVIG